MFNLRTTLLTLLSLTFLLSAANLQAQKEGRKKRIAVLSFNDRSDSNFGWYGSKSVGDGVSDMIVTELVKSGEYRVIEREQINRILAEQDMGASGAVTAESAAKIGQLLGVEIALFGSVTEFGYKNSDTGINIKGTSLGVGKQSAVAGMDIRLVNTNTGEILSAENIRRTKNALSGRARVKNVGFNNQKDFDQSLVGKVTREAVEDVIKLVNKNAESIPWQAKVITVQGDKVYINSGAIDGLKEGETFSVYRKGQTLIDPDTGLELGSVDKKVGEIKVADNSVGSGKASICTIVSGGDFERGDVVKQ